tara:strand:+ start:155242 stop:155826 length:585 start_codon:yes stop_codon:yes gene_type:complete
MQNKQSEKTDLHKYHLRAKRKSLAVGTFIGLFIISTPIIFYSYQGFPDEKYWESFLGLYESKYYKSVQIMAWFLFSKLIPLLLLLVWFITCKHWWYYAILIPISMYVFQIFNLLNDDLYIMDSSELILIIPLIAVVAAISYTIRTKIFDRLYGVDLDQELKRVRWNGKIVKIPADSPLDLPEVDDDEVDDELED